MVYFETADDIISYGGEFMLRSPDDIFNDSDFYIGLDGAINHNDYLIPFMTQEMYEILFRKFEDNTFNINDAKSFRGMDELFINNLYVSVCLFEPIEESNFELGSADLLI